MILQFKYMMVTIALVSISGISAQAQCAPEPLAQEKEGKVQLLENAALSDNDAPTGQLLLRIPEKEESPDNGTPGTEINPMLPFEGGRIPTVETPGEPPIYIGEEIEGSVLWVIDISLSMGKKDAGGAIEDWNGDTITSPSRLDAVKAELINTLRDLDETHRFDIVCLAGCENGNNQQHAPPVCDTWKDSLVVANKDNKQAAETFVAGLSMRFGTPTYTALEIATHRNGSDIDQLFVLSDGAPTHFDVVDANGSQQKAKSIILNRFPDWYAPLRSEGCELYCVHVGDNPNAGDFMETLATQNMGTYLKP